MLKFELNKRLINLNFCAQNLAAFPFSETKMARLPTSHFVDLKWSVIRQQRAAVPC